MRKNTCRRRETHYRERRKACMQGTKNLKDEETNNRSVRQRGRGSMHKGKKCASKENCSRPKEKHMQQSEGMREGVF